MPSGQVMQPLMQKSIAMRAHAEAAVPSLPQDAILATSGIDISLLLLSNHSAAIVRAKHSRASNGILAEEICILLSSAALLRLYVLRQVPLPASFKILSTAAAQN